MRVFYELARAVSAGPYDVREILEAISAQIRRAFGFERALLVRYDPETRTLHAFVQQGIHWPGDMWLMLEKFPFLERALEERRAVCVEDAMAEGAAPRTILERFGATSLVAVPLLIEGRCLGFIVADRAGQRFRLDKRALELLTALGLVAAVFIDRADQYAELQSALEELRTLDQAKSDFISIASHELRTPIAVVYGITSTLHLRGHELRRDQLVELRRTLYEQASRLQTLADQLLDLSRLDAGAVEISSEPFRPRELLDSLLPKIAPDRLTDVAVDVDPALEVTTDPNVFERIASNLLTNAFRYGRPPVFVRGEADDSFRLVIEDRGPGVEPSFVPELFKRFSRSDRTRRMNTDGAGLGLAIASSFAQRLGGQLTYEDAEPTGARFTLALPA